MFGDRGKQDVRLGGTLSCTAVCKGAFIRVRPDKDLRLTWEHKGCKGPMQLDVMFQTAQDKCLMNVMTSRIQTRPEADGLRRGWAETLSRLKSLCES